MDEYDAFISYNHAADGRLAPALKDGLEQLARPWRRRRALRVFQDTTGLGATPELWGTVAQALERSRYLVALASPEAAASPWVRREIEHFRAQRPDGAILLVLTDGSLRWSVRDADFDWTASTAVPRALAGAYSEEPLYIDVRWVRTEDHVSLLHPRFRQAVGDLAAPIHGVERDALDARDLLEFRRARRARRSAMAGLVVLSLLTSVAAVLAIVNAARADRQAEISEAGRLAALSTSMVDDRTDLAVLLALHSLGHAETTDGRLAFTRAMTKPAAATGVVPGAEGFGYALAAGTSDVLAVSSATSGDVGVVPAGGSFQPRLLHGHGATVIELSFTPDDDLLASVDVKGELRVHDVASGDVVRAAPGIADAEFVRVGRRLVVVGTDGAVSATDLGADAPAWVVPAVSPPSDQPGNRAALATSDDGSLVAVATSDRRVVLLDARDGRTLRAWDAGPTDANDVAFSRSGLMLAGAGDDGVVRMWDVLGGNLVREVRGSTAELRRVTWAKDDSTVASTGFDTRVRIVDSGNGRLVADLATGAWANAALVSASDGHTLYSGSIDGLRRWDLTTGRPERIVAGPGTGVWDVAVTPDGSTLALRAADHVEFRRVDQPQSYARLDIPGSGIAIHDGRAYVGADDRRVHVVDLASGAVVGVLDGLDDVPDDVTVSTRGDVAAKQVGGGVSVWAADGHRRWTHPALEGSTRLAWSPDGATLAATIRGQADLFTTEIDLLDVATGDRTATARLSPTTAEPSALAWSPDRSTLALGWSDGRLDLVDAGTLQVRRGTVAHQNRLQALAFSPDGLMLATGGFNGGGRSADGFDGGLRLWDVGTLQKVADLRRHDRQLRSVRSGVSTRARWRGAISHRSSATATCSLSIGRTPSADPQTLMAQSVHRAGRDRRAGPLVRR